MIPSKLNLGAGNHFKYCGRDALQEHYVTEWDPTRCHLVAVHHCDTTSGADEVDRYDVYLHR